MKKLRMLVAAVVGVVAFGAAPASASSAPIVITYAKDCNQLGLCVGSAGDGGTFVMQVTGFRPTGKAAQLTMTEEITVGDISFTAQMTAHASPAGFIVLNGTVTDGDFLGAQVHQRSNLVGTSADGTVTSWVGEQAHAEVRLGESCDITRGECPRPSTIWISPADRTSAVAS